MEYRNIEKKLFIMFLKKNKIYYRYIKYKPRVYFNTHSDPYCWIGWAFPFHYTVEGQYFWGIMSGKWQKVLRNYRKNNIII